MYKSKLKFYLHIYFEMFAQNLKSQMMYRADFFISLLGMVFTNIAGLIIFYINILLKVGIIMKYCSCTAFRLCH